MPSWPNLSECLSHNCSWEETHNFTRNSDLDLPPLNYYSIPLLTGITIACTLLFLVGVVGNVMTILVVSKYRDMRTTTNLYLCSMAVSDLLIFLCMPLDLYRMWRYRPWRFGDALCKLFQFVSESCTYSTILSITALSVERYLAICFPLRAKALVTKRRVRALILLLWTVSLLSAGPVFVMVGVERDSMGPPDYISEMNETGFFLEAGDTRECKMTHYAVESGLMGAMVWLSSVFFFMPVFCLTVLYSLIGRRLWQRHRETNISSRVAHRDKSNRQTIKMLVVVVLAFVLCWLPFHVGRYLQFRSLDAPSPLLSLLSEYCSLVSVVLFYLSAAINPILYNTMSWKYRGAAARLFGLTDNQLPRGRTASTVKGDGSNGWTESTVSF
ncbi:growth hormone secretagogue receptor a [Thunnus albacares]|uniref:growth hormone secretagogue receptor a n=1 Tax=Thunnus maccoyii TaxID=8240 RepID=UPI001C4B620B|nr:growth hormone secretagogue receptor a [Thunnus maccoyii]XP_044231237.1 growth hormone secretagogue receptor a [Thunnus albacares]|eukprot:superscaffoldBa00002818_g15371